MSKTRAYEVVIYNIGIGFSEFILTSDGTIIASGGKETKIRPLRDVKGCINFLERKGMKYEELNEQQIETYINPEGL